MAPVYRLRGRLLPLLYLNQELRLGRGSAPRNERDGAVNIVVLRADERQFGLVVDEINDTEEIVVKPLRKQLKTVKTFAGSSIMGDGKVALILDVLGLAQRPAWLPKPETALSPKGHGSAATAGETQTFLLFAAPATVAWPYRSARWRASKSFPWRKWKCPAASGYQYRGQILPLIRLNVVLQEQEREKDRRNKLRTMQAPQHLIPDRIQGPGAQSRGRSFGLVVERILDIVEDRADVKSAATRPVSSIPS